MGNQTTFLTNKTIIKMKKIILTFVIISLGLVLNADAQIGSSNFSYSGTITTNVYDQYGYSFWSVQTNVNLYGSGYDSYNAGYSNFNAYGTINSTYYGSYGNTLGSSYTNLDLSGSVNTNLYNSSYSTYTNSYSIPDYSSTYSSPYYYH
jgi:hypothetical protein